MGEHYGVPGSKSSIALVHTHICGRRDVQRAGLSRKHLLSHTHTLFFVYVYCLLQGCALSDVKGHNSHSLIHSSESEDEDDEPEAEESEELDDNRPPALPPSPPLPPSPAAPPAPPAAAQPAAAAPRTSASAASSPQRQS